MTEARPCPVCDTLVSPYAGFCPTCGTAQGEEVMLYGVDSAPASQEGRPAGSRRSSSLYRTPSPTSPPVAPPGTTPPTAPLPTAPGAADPPAVAPGPARAPAAPTPAPPGVPFGATSPAASPPAAGDAGVAAAGAGGTPPGGYAAPGPAYGAAPGYVAPVASVPPGSVVSLTGAPPPNRSLKVGLLVTGGILLAVIAALATVLVLRRPAEDASAPTSAQVAWSGEPKPGVPLTVAVSAQPNLPDGVATTVLLVDGSEVARQAGLVGSLTWPDPTPGTHSLTARLVLKDGRTVDSTASSVSIASTTTTTTSTSTTQPPATAPKAVTGNGGVGGGNGAGGGGGGATDEAATADALTVIKEAEDAVLRKDWNTFRARFPQFSGYGDAKLNNDFGFLQAYVVQVASSSQSGSQTTLRTKFATHENGTYQPGTNNPIPGVEVTRRYCASWTVDRASRRINRFGDVNQIGDLSGYADLDATVAAFSC